MSYTKEFNPRYSSVSLEATADIINIPANKPRVYKAGTPMVTFTDFLGRNHYLPYRTKKQYAEIVQYIGMFRRESITLSRIFSDYSVKNGKYVNEPALKRELKNVFGFSTKAINILLQKF